MPFVLGLGRRGVLAGAALLAGCQAPPAPAEVEIKVPRLGPNRTGYIGIQAPIVNGLRDAFITDVNQLLDQNAAEIYVLISSPGGTLDAAQDIISFMDRTHADRKVNFVTHNTGVVASAACYVFLAGQRRLSIPQGAFLFHQAALVSNGPISSQRVQEESANLQRAERSFVTMLTAKTRLTPAEATSFTRRTVILTADEARRDGIIDATAGFTLPTGATISQIRSVQRPATPAAAPAPAGPAATGLTRPRRAGAPRPVPIRHGPPVWQPAWQNMTLFPLNVGLRRP